MKRKIFSLFLMMTLLLSGCGEVTEKSASVPDEEPAASYTSPWGEQVAVQAGFERIAGAAEAGMTSGQELLLLDYMERYYRSIADFEIEPIRDLFSTEEEAAYHRCVWNSICTIRQTAQEDLTLQGYTYTLSVENMKIADAENCTITVCENNVQYFTALSGTPSEQWRVEHIFTIQRLFGDRWVIVKHTSDDNPFANVDYDAAAGTDRNLEALLANIKARYAAQSEAVSEIVRSYDHAYDRSEAKSYMLQYVTQRDQSFGAYDDGGGNCMNFGSQVLLAGGIPFDRSGGKSLSWYSSGGRHSASFINVGSFLYYAKANSGAGLVALVGVNYYTGDVGDIITMGIEDAREHTTVICDVLTNQQGETIDYLLCSNTANLRNFPAGAYYYTNQQVTKILGWND